jgi:TolB-like protein/Tfp pilus assembly protein PilF
LAIFEELKRRNVFKVAISYVIVAWLLLQVSDTLAPALLLPEWFQSGVAFVLIIGFPIALFFAWAFELTPDGLRRDSGSEQDAPAPSTGQRLNGLIIILLVVALAYFAYDEFVIEKSPVSSEQTVEHPAAESASREKSIAVLPFVDMSPQKDQEYMSDGIAEELLNLLAQIPDLKVTSRSSAFSFKGKDVDIPTVAGQLNVAYVLEGSVRKAGEKLRITTQLIEAESDRHLWSETYDKTLEDVFAIQDEIAAAVVEQLSVTLLGEVPRSRVVAEQAYVLALQARFFWNRRAEGDVERALDLYRQALELQPDYALAWTGVSVALAVQALAGDIPREEGLEQAREAAESALELDPMLSEAHVRMGQAQMRAGDLEAGYESYRRALELAPDSVLALGVMGQYLRTIGQIEEGVALLQRSVKLDPMGAIWWSNLGSLLIQAERYAEAEAALARLRELNPDALIEIDLALIALVQGRPSEALDLISGVPEDRRPPDLMAGIYHGLGMHAESDRILQSVSEGDSVMKVYWLPNIRAARGEHDQAFAALEELLPDMRGRRGAVEYDPILRHYLSDDARWLPMLQRFEGEGD